MVMKMEEPFTLMTASAQKVIILFSRFFEAEYNLKTFLMPVRGSLETRMKNWENLRKYRSSFVHIIFLFSWVRDRVNAIGKKLWHKNKYFAFTSVFTCDFVPRDWHLCVCIELTWAWRTIWSESCILNNNKIGRPCPLILTTVALFYNIIQFIKFFMMN